MDVVRYRLAREAGEPSAAIPRQARWSSLAFEEVAALLARGHSAAARTPGRAGDRRHDGRADGGGRVRAVSGEQELLAYLPTRLANVELAQRCYVSVNTIKTHVSHIYRKLGVQGRSAAVTRAVELGLLPETAVELHPTAR
ncbi:hypothetical protein XI38_03360 [Microbacterium aurantiacum]|uniref:HTH luxR-type domain-containing protein n=2 Tax=Microbacterium aurantiacum TaxID=162393 RepID=A0A0M8MQ71_9MICO|nr:hypothetical protein XI38_03360 [Microbacterium chocolatum]